MLVPRSAAGKKGGHVGVLSITLFTLSCQPCLTRYHFLSFLDTRVFDCSSFPHHLMFTTPRLQRRFRTVVTIETGTPCMKLVRFWWPSVLLRQSKSPPFIRVPRVQHVFVDNDSGNSFRKFGLFKGRLCTHATVWPARLCFSSDAGAPLHDERVFTDPQEPNLQLDFLPARCH